MILFIRFLSCLPLRLLHALGALLGRLAWLASPRYRRHLAENMRQALGPEAARRLRASAIAHAGRQALELPKIWLRPLDEVAQRVTRVSGLDLVDSALAEGRGIVFLTPHLGCFEIAAQYISTRMPITVMYRPPKRPWLQTLIETGRARPQLFLATADLPGVRILLKALRRGQAVGLLPDQAPKVGEGRWIDFFGRPAYTMTLAARLTESGAAVLMVWAERLPHGAGYHFRIRRPTREIAGATAERARLVSLEIEDLIRECPEQYLWGYNRYKQPRGSGSPEDQD